MTYRRLALAAALLGCLGAMSAIGDDNGHAPAPVTDAAQVGNHYRAVVLRPEFQDSGDINIDDRLREVLAQWFYQLGEKMSQFKYVSEMSRVASMMLTGMVILCVGGFIYVVARIYRRRGRFDLDEEEAAPGGKIFRAPEFYEKEIRDAVAARDWHTAWLAAWRQFLSRLENRQLVEADRTRTNREYLAQLRERTLPSPALELLTGLVDAYDLFIYGRKPIAEPDWNQFQRQVGEAGLLLHLDHGHPQPEPSTS
jgi:hypothetical protein